MAIQSAAAISCFFFIDRGQYIPAGIAVYVAKTEAQLQYGAPIWIEGIKAVSDKFAKPLLCFLHMILGTRSVCSLEVMTWIRTLKYSLKALISELGHNLLPHWYFLRNLT